MFLKNAHDYRESWTSTAADCSTRKIHKRFFFKYRAFKKHRKEYGNLTRYIIINTQQFTLMITHSWHCIIALIIHALVCHSETNDEHNIPS